MSRTLLVIGLGVKFSEVLLQIFTHHAAVVIDFGTAAA